jgi:hypothetical protein
MKQQYNEKDFQYFKKRVMHWRLRLGLMDWDVVCKFASFSPDVGADCCADHISRMAEIRLNSALSADGMRPVNNATLDQWALHECLHVLLAEYRWFTVHTEDKKLTAVEHGVIRAIENLLLGEDR